MIPEPRLPRAVSLAEIQDGTFEIATTASPSQNRGPETSSVETGRIGGHVRAVLSLRNIIQPLPLPKGAELISLTTYEGKLVVLTSKGPYIRQGGSWEKILASQPDPELA
jgi:hypothetical protein